MCGSQYESISLLDFIFPFRFDCLSNWLNTSDEMEEDDVGILTRSKHKKKAQGMDYFIAIICLHHQWASFFHVDAVHHQNLPAASVRISRSKKPPQKLNVFELTKTGKFNNQILTTQRNRCNSKKLSLTKMKGLFLLLLE